MGKGSTGLGLKVQQADVSEPDVNMILTRDIYMYITCVLSFDKYRRLHATAGQASALMSDHMYT